ncbi:hypothetical protein ACQCN2_06240 [Brevibacillus ginsengisoli]|uniref:hypothetical protein n=1 Tax=Brevibacillus ginsengisoli TaxID=363854 RepID=UPI003CE7D58B
MKRNENIYKWAATLGVLTVLVATPVCMAQEPVATVVNLQQKTTLIGLDNKITVAIQHKIQELAPNSKIELGAVRETENMWYIKSVDEKSQFEVEKATGIVNKALIKFPYNELEPKWKSKGMEAVKMLAPARTLTFDTAVRNLRGDGPNKGKVMTILEGADGSVWFQGDQLIHAVMNTAVSQVDPKIVAASNIASKSLKIGTQLKDVHRVYSDIDNMKKNVWKLEFLGSGKYTSTIEIGAETGKVVRFRNGEEEQKFISQFKSLTEIKDEMFRGYTKEKVIAVAAPLAKKMLDIDLKGYDMQRGVMQTPNYFVFSKKGSPTLHGMMTDKGVFYSMWVTQENGIVQ